jgi:hypothetical protein
MKLKSVILEVLDRDALKYIVGKLELDGVDLRIVENMSAALSRAHQATSKVLLHYLYEDEIKEVCERVGVSPTGRRLKLESRLLRHETRLPRNRAGAVVRKPSVKKVREDRPSQPAIYRNEDDEMNDQIQAGDVKPPVAEEAPVRLPEAPPGMLRLTRTELVWPGKYNDDGTLREVPRVRLPFQVIERVNESRATRDTRKNRGSTLFDIWDRSEGDTFETGWRNKLIWGDNRLVMSSLLEQFAGKIDLIYIDPPFGTGVDFSFTTEVGEGAQLVERDQSVIEEKAYRDTWGRGTDSYLQMMWQRLSLLRDLLAPSGTLYVHIDWTVGHYLKLALDEVFGRDNFRNEVIWFYTNKLGTGGNTFDKHHDNLLVYVNGGTWKHNPLYRAAKNQKMQPVTQKIGGERVWLRDEEGKRLYAMGKRKPRLVMFGKYHTSILLHPNVSAMRLRSRKRSLRM